MAGAGFKDFSAGDVLTATDVDTYLMQQTVMVFADAAARSSALGANVSEGMMSYLKDTNLTYRYDGAAWVSDAGATSPLTTKGDLWTYSTLDTRLGVGANGTVLTADSAETTGLKWATAASGGMTLLTSGTISSSPLNLTSISQDYKELVLYLYDYTSASNNATLLRLNNSSSSIYYSASVDSNNTGSQTTGQYNATSLDINQNDYNANEQNNNVVLRFPNYTVAAWKVFYFISMVTLAGGTNFGIRNGGGVFRTTTAISQINILNQTSGSYELYGVK